MVAANQIVIIAKEGEAKALKEVLNELVAYSLGVNGCQKYELYQLNEHREDFFIIEIFKSEKKHATYLKEEQYQNLKTKILELCEEFSMNELKLPQCLTQLGLKEK